MYAELVCRSNFSFLQGASHPEELVTRAAELGLSALALTDQDGLYGVVKAYLQARALGLKLLVASRLTLTDGPEVVALVQDARGTATSAPSSRPGGLPTPRARRGCPGRPWPSGLRASSWCCLPQRTSPRWRHWPRPLRGASTSACAAPSPPGTRRGCSRRWRWPAGWGFRAAPTTTCTPTCASASRCRTCWPASATASAWPRPAFVSSPTPSAR